MVCNAVKSLKFALFWLIFFLPLFADDGYGLEEGDVVIREKVERDLDDEAFKPYDIYIKDMHVENYRYEKEVWALDAEEAFIYQNAQYMQTLKTMVILYKEGGVSTKVTSGAAAFYQKTNDIFFSGEVFIETSSGMKVSSQTMHYDGKTREFYTENPVKVTYPSGTTVNGAAMSADENLKYIAFKNKASGRYVKEDGAPKIP